MVEVDIDALRARVAALGSVLAPPKRQSKFEKQLAAKRDKAERKKVRQVEYLLSVAAKGTTYKNGLDVARADFEKIAATLNVNELPSDVFAAMVEDVWTKRVAKLQTRGFQARQMLKERKEQTEGEFKAIEESILPRDVVEQSGANAVRGTIYSKIAASRPVNRTAARVVSGGR